MLPEQHAAPAAVIPQRSFPRFVMIAGNAFTQLSRPTQVGLLCGVAAFFLYAVTCSRGVEWQDSGVHQYRVIFGVLENPLGLALSHPLHYWLGRMFLWLPLGEPAFRLNLMSACSGAAGVGLLAAVVAMTTHGVLPAVAAAATLAVSHTYWQMSAMTETYTLAAALMALEWLLLVRFAQRRSPKWLVAVFFVNGLHVADHLLGLLTLVTYGALLIERVARRRIGPEWFLAASAAWMLGAAPYLLLVVSHLATSGAFGATLYSALFGVGVGGSGYAAEVLNTSLSWRLVLNTVLYWGYNFPSLALPLALYGVTRSTRGAMRMFRAVLIVQSVIIVLFVSRYSIGDQITFFVPVCAVTALWLGVAVDHLLRDERPLIPRRWVRPVVVACAVLPVLTYLAFPPVARSRGWLSGQMRSVPFRDAYSHFLQPWKVGDDSGERFARAALDAAGPGGWLLSDLSTGYMTAVLYRERRDPPGVRIFSRRTDLTEPGRANELSNDELAEELEHGRRVAAVPFDAIEEWWGDHFAIKRDSPFWRFESETGGVLRGTP